MEGDVRLFGFLFLPEPDIRKNIGFVVIHPFAEEKKSSHRTLVELSGELYKKGFPVLMFDLRGCGDSEGDFVSVRLSDWLTDIDRAMHVLREHTQLPKMGIIGLRTGAWLFWNKVEDVDNEKLIDTVCNYLTCNHTSY